MTILFWITLALLAVVVVALYLAINAVGIVDAQRAQAIAALKQVAELQGDAAAEAAMAAYMNLNAKASGSL